MVGRARKFGNSLRTNEFPAGANEFPAGARKFPARLFREFYSKSLNLLADLLTKIPGKGQNRKIPCKISLVAGKFG